MAVFHDIGPGTATDRPGVAEMLDFLRAPGNEGCPVIVCDPAVLGRSLGAYTQLRAAIVHAGGRLESPSFEFGEKPESILMENLLFSAKEYVWRKEAEERQTLGFLEPVRELS